MTPADDVDALWRAHLRTRLSRGETPIFVAEGHSMWPSIRAGETVQIVPLSPAGPGVGAVVLAVHRGVRVLHRVIATRPGAVLLKGDANPRADGWCELAWVVGQLAPRRCDRLRARLSACAGPRVAWFIGLCRTRLG